MHEWLLATLIGLTQDVPNPHEFVDRYHARMNAIENLVVVSEWQDTAKGEPSRRDYQTLIEDSLGRRRLKMVSEVPGLDGAWIRHKETPYEWDFLFDGQISVNMTFDPRKDRVGKESTSDAKGGYHTAQISDGHFEGLKNQRTPLTFVSPYVRHLETALQNKQQVNIEALADGHFDIQCPADVQDHILHFHVDSNRDWIPIVVVQRDASGKATHLTELEYQTSAEGAYYINKGRHRFYGKRPESEAPLLDTIFEIKDCRINDPDFSEENFRFKLVPDTAVQDLRFGVLYRVGETEAVTEQLAALAEAAVNQREQDAPPGITVTNETISKPVVVSTGNRWTIWLNGVIVAVVTVVLLLLNRLRRRTSA